MIVRDQHICDDATVAAQQLIHGCVLPCGHGINARIAFCMV